MSYQLNKLKQGNQYSLLYNTLYKSHNCLKYTQQCTKHRQQHLYNHSRQHIQHRHYTHNATQLQPYVTLPSPFQHIHNINNTLYMNSSNNKPADDAPENSNNSNSTPFDSNNNGNNNNDGIYNDIVSLVPMSTQHEIDRVSFDTFPKPKEILMLPTAGPPAFPGQLIQLDIYNSTTRQILKRQLREKNSLIGLFMIKQDVATVTDSTTNNTKSTTDETDATDTTESTETDTQKDSTTVQSDNQNITELKQIYHTGVMAHYNFVKDDDDKLRISLLCVRRITIDLTDTTLQPDNKQGGLLTVPIKHFTEPAAADTPAEQTAIQAYQKEMMSTLMQLRQLTNTITIRMQHLSNAMIVNLSNAAHFADWCAMLTSADAQPQQLQDILDTFDVKQRLEKAHSMLLHELQVQHVRTDIQKNVQSKFTKQQEKTILKEQKKIIDKMLGTGRANDKQALIKKFNDRLQYKTMPAEAQKVYDEELNKFQSLDPEQSEYNITRNYLDWLTILPWSHTTSESYDIQHAESILNTDHYGLDDVKQRILEFIAIGHILQSIPQGKVLCLIGPPGVGKTSIGKSIARALGREFFRFSVGGVDDVSEMKGHRRTYVGAMPGKLIQALKKVQCSNPVILIDEIDKIGRGYRGDPSAVLLEVLDPEQNNSFVDHYLDVGVDLSKILFICTANDDSTIPIPLKDRMDFVRISGYVWNEKIHIARNYLQQQISQKTGITAEQLQLSDDALIELIRWYCREPGVRNLQKHIEKIYRKVALEIVKNKTNHTENQPAVVITSDNLTKYVGQRVYSSDRLYDTMPIGVATGMAWSSMGGSTMFIEATVSEHISKRKSKKDDDSSEEGMPHGDLFVTGQVGDVMKESSQIAYTVAKNQLLHLAPNSHYFNYHRIHLHAPAGATPKEGPSAGITMCVSILSLALQLPIPNNIAMTGELALTGKVLPIGGVKEKILAAKRANINTVILPYDNQKDYAELQDFIKSGLTVHFVDHFDHVRQIVFPTLKDLPFNTQAAGVSTHELITINEPTIEDAKIIDTTTHKVIDIPEPSGKEQIDDPGMKIEQ